MRKRSVKVIALTLVCALVFCVTPIHAEEMSVNTEEKTENMDGNSEITTDNDFSQNEEEQEASIPEEANEEEEIAENTQNDFTDISPQVQSEENTIENQTSAMKKNTDVTGKVELVSTDFSKGVFTVRVYEIADLSVIQDVRFAVWSKKDNQDDLVWSIVSQPKDDSFYMDVKLADHHYSTGIYVVNAYIVTDTGEQIGIGSIECDMGIESSVLNISEGDNVGEYYFDLEQLEAPGGEKGVSFAVWSETNGQDDLRWYDAEKSEDGAYHYDWTVKKHKSLGKYIVHAYVRTKADTLEGIGAYEFNIDTPQVESVEIKDITIEEGKFVVEISGISENELVKTVMIPVWSETDGQDDLVWYEAKRTAAGEYELRVDIKNHKYTDGLYHAHVYIEDITGNQYFAGSTEGSLSVEKGSLLVKPINDKKYAITLSGLQIPGGISEVLFPVWSENGGQDDLKWYSAKKDESGAFVYDLDLAKHKGLGKYNVHAYAKKKNGVQISLASVQFTTATPDVNRFEINSIDKADGHFTIKISDIDNEDLIKNIKVPVWSKTDQRDLIWYNAKRTLSGEYVVEVNIKDHSYNIGKYNIHCYVEDITGGLSGVGSQICDMSAEMSSLTTEAKDKTEKEYHISLNDLKVPAGEKEVRIAVWGEKDGQNDLKWYSLGKQLDGNYSLDIKISDHCELGTYNVHAYCVTRGGGMEGLGTTTFEVSSVPIFANVVTSDIDGNKGTFKVTVTGLNAASGIQKVEMPIWCNDNQSDLIWYTAVKSSDFDYTVTMNVKNHQYHFGDYKVHVYVTMGNGIRVGISSSTIQNLSPNNYLYNEYVSDSQRRVLLLGCNAELVQFPTWSDANGQDDIVWYNGSNDGNGNWSVVVDSANHSSGGNYTTHAYVTKNGVRNSVGATTYSLTKVPTDQEMMRLRANAYSSSTGYIALVNRTTHKVGIFQGWQGNWKCIQYWDCSDGAPSTPTVEGVFRVGSKGHHFYSGSSICYWYTQFYGNYLFHSVLYNRYSGALADGRLGMALSHGCVRLHIDNAKWIYDNIPVGTTVVVYH